MRLTALLNGKESLISHGIALASTADNLANVNTPGFKSQRAEFQNLLAQNQGGLFSLGTTTSGNGSKVEQLTTRHDLQGIIDFTNRDLDFAISGNGYFTLQQGENQLFTRSGTFTADAAGNIATLNGELLQGFTAASPTTLVPLNINSVALNPTATTTVSLVGNLDASTALVDPINAPEDFFELNTTSTFSQGVQVVDSLGTEHEVVLHFFHNDDLTWTVSAFTDALETGEAESAPQPLGSTTIDFLPTGAQPEGAAPSLTITPQFSNGSSAQPITFDLSQVSGFSSASFFSNVTNDGIVPGQPQGVELTDDGTLVARLANGEFATIGTVALATFTSTAGLKRVGDNKFAATNAAGEITFGNPNIEGRGSVQSGALEVSNVDPAGEIVEVIRFQRGYQAGSTVVRTMSELLDTTIQIA